MKVNEVMTKTPYYCQPETNLGSATELMWNANCGFLSVEAQNGKVIGVITDRDICIALGTRSRLPGDIAVGEGTKKGPLSQCVPALEERKSFFTGANWKTARLYARGSDSLSAPR